MLLLYCLSPSLNTQSCNRSPLCSTFTFENVRTLKKFYSKKKILKKLKQNKTKNIMQLFSAGAIVFSKKKSRFFLTPKTWKNCPQKLLTRNRPQTFLCTGPAAEMAQKQKCRTTKSPFMQDLVFRLGSKQFFRGLNNSIKYFADSEKIAAPPFQ